MLVFPIEPGSIKGLGLIGLGIFLVLFLVAGLIGASIWSARGATFEVNADGIRLRGDLYGRLIPMASIQIDQVRRVDFEQDPSLRPSWRTMGTGLPGYQGGWFRLKDGSKALVYLTNPSKAVFVPTDLGYGVLISPKDPDGLVEALKGLKSPKLSPS
ncbi:MAG: PH domain-containing protein [Gemmataceae bacterium]